MNTKFSFASSSDSGELIKLPARITRGFVQSHPNWLFVFSNDFFQKGCEGMPWSFVGEPNAFMVPTMKKMCNSATDKYFRDEQAWIIEAIDKAIARIPIDDRPIIPIRKMGMGHSRMIEVAPKTYKYMWNKLNKIAYPYIEWSNTL